MLLVPDASEQEIAATAAAFLAAEFPLARLHGARADHDRLGEFAALGWLGLSAPEANGGSGLGVIEEMLFFYELGRVAGPVGVLAQVLAIAAAGDERELCAALIAGETPVALVVQRSEEAGIRFVGAADRGYALEVTPAGATLFAVRGGDCTEVPCLDRSVRMHTGPASALEQRLHVAGDRLWYRAQVAVSAMLVGTAECAQDMTVAYAKVRETFGRPIGAYQAVRHPCADMAMRIEGARCQLYYAATALQEQQADARLHVDAARLLADRAAKANTDANIQLHGGIGVTEEFDAHLLLKRANLLWRLFGASQHRMRTLLGLDDAAEGLAHGEDA